MENTTLLYFDFYLFFLLCLITFFYIFINKNLSKSNLKISITFGLTCTGLSILLFVGYFLLYGMSFGAINTSLEPFLVSLPWIIKFPNTIFFPFALGIFIFGIVLSSLTLIQAYQAPKQNNFLTLLALLLFVAGIFLILIIGKEWRKDQNLISNIKTYTTLASQSHSESELTKIFEDVSTSHDPDVNDFQMIIPTIASNPNASKTLLSTIYYYALTLKTYKKNQILESLTKNPQTPSTILTALTAKPPESPYGLHPVVPQSLVYLSSNPNATQDELNNIYLKIANLSEQDYNVKTILENLAKNPNTPIDLLRKIWQKISASPSISMPYISLAENPNTPPEILSSLINKLNEQVNPNYSMQTFLIETLLKRPALQPEILQELIHVPNCNLRRNIFESLMNSKTYFEWKQKLIADEKDMGNLYFFYNNTQQKVFNYASSPDDTLTQDELRQMQTLINQINAINDPGNLSSLFHSITDNKVLYQVLDIFARNKAMSSELANEIYNAANQSSSMFVKLKAFIPLAGNPNTPSEMLKPIIQFAITEIDKGNLIWYPALIAAARNPHLPTDQMQLLSTLPSCELKNILSEKQATQ